MEKDGVIERVTSANSAAPIAVVGKKDSEDVRVCGDFSVTYNASAHVETYPMPQTLSFKRMHGVQCPGYKAGLSSSTNCERVPDLSYNKHTLGCVHSKDCQMAFILVLLSFSESWIICCRTYQRLLVVWIIFLLVAQVKRTTFIHFH